MRTFWTTFWIPGAPATQGSKSPGRGGFGFHESDKKLPAWRDAVKVAAKQAAAGNPPCDFPVIVTLDVYLKPTKQSLFGRFHAVKPDLDKLQRAVGDGLTAGGLLKDDSRIIRWEAQKHFAEDATQTGARVTIRQAAEKLPKPKGRGSVWVAIIDELTGAGK